MDKVKYLFATEEQKEFANFAREILETKLLPRIEEFEKGTDGLGQFPMDVFQTMVESGLYAMNVPESYGGAGFDTVTQALIVNEMAKVDHGFTFSFYNMGTYFPQIMMTSMPEEEKREWAGKLISGEARGTFAVTESGAGSDAGAMRTTAVLDGDEWVINGTKAFITSAPMANFVLVAARTDKTKPASLGTTFFFVEKERGWTVGKKEHKMGLKLSETAEMIFDEVRVPKDHVIGEVGKGFGTAMGIISTEGRVIGAAIDLGIAEAALEIAIEYAKERRQFGKRIIDHQGLGFMIADMQTRTDASRALLYETLQAFNKGIKVDRRLCSEVKYFVSDNTTKTCSDAIEVLGGYGYMYEYRVEKMLRDAKIFQIFSGTNQIQRNTVVRQLAGRDPLKQK